MFALLLLAPGAYSLDEIASQLEVSKASVSTNARVLLRHGWLRRVVRPGDRRDYYEMVPDFFAEFVAFRLRQWQVLYNLVGDALPRLDNLADESRRRLEYLQEVQEFFLAGLGARLTEWQQRERRAVVSA